MLMPLHEYLEFVTMSRELQDYLAKKYDELDIIYSQPIDFSQNLCRTKEDCDRWLEKAVKYDREQRAKKK